MQSALQLGVVRTYGPRAAQAPGKHSGGVEHGSLQPGCVVVLPGCIRSRGRLLHSKMHQQQRSCADICGGRSRHHQQHNCLPLEIYGAHRHSGP